jgi:hypothetical protein
VTIIKDKIVNELLDRKGGYYHQVLGFVDFRHPEKLDRVGGGLGQQVVVHQVPHG